MQGSQQQAYDRGITIFSPDGRLYQVEYAREAVERGTPSVGVRTKDGVVFAAAKNPRSPLLETESVEKLHAVDNHIGIASAGHVADGRRLVDVARKQAQVEQLRYGETIDVETLTKSITDHVQEFTQTGGARPFGVALLVGGIDDGQPRLFETDPSGTFYEWSAAAVGRDRTEVQKFLEEEYREDADLDGGIDLALSALASVDEDDLASSTVTVATVDIETGAYRTLDPEEVDSYIAEIDTEGEQ